jgi:hypothetical protein
MASSDSCMFLHGIPVDQGTDQGVLIQGMTDALLSR